ncbi:hypothetical protein IQ273_25370 [Nodosilinea sp. LEGE 07298]|jgi:hypothetical protein|uniref:hypothetical protein n=1 Tax=Nodosilinea sp. LEGE 07298 TaxID=2777970 RepID=UPI00187E8993|nr:hypothetical protein [Nodosilinea sp. LEGE 07298]MBE9112724.1 hypothetical protein [Nodosilinea sp. LEGE 07298]
MNAPLDHADVQAAALSGELALEPATASSARETAPALNDKICWVEVHQVPYPPDQQVELLHLQAEAEALLLQLQARHQRRQSASPVS